MTHLFRQRCTRGTPPCVEGVPRAHLILPCVGESCPSMPQWLWIGTKERVGLVDRYSDVVMRWEHRGMTRWLGAGCALGPHTPCVWRECAGRQNSSHRDLASMQAEAFA